MSNTHPYAGTAPSGGLFDPTESMLEFDRAAEARMLEFDRAAEARMLEADRAMGLHTGIALRRPPAPAPKVLQHDVRLSPLRVEPVESLVPDVAFSTLGRKAITAHTYAAVEEQQFDDTVTDTGLMTVWPGTKVHTLLENIESREQTVAQELESIRERMSGLTTNQAWQFEKYCDTSVPEFLKKVKKKLEANPDDSWVNWLSSKADDDQLLNFLQWHTNTIERLAAEPSIAEEAERQKSLYKKAITRGINERWLHPDAQAAIGKTDDVKVRVGDLFDTRFQQRGGYAYHDSREIVAAVVASVSPDEDYEPIIRHLKLLEKHELNHAVLGKFETRWLNEALTEHIVEAMEFGKAKDLNPWSRKKHSFSYVAERHLLSRVLQDGTERIPVKTAMVAYSEPGESGRERTAFIEAINRSWAHLVPEGESAYDNLNLYITSLEQRLMDEEGLGRMEAGERAVNMVSGRFKDYNDLRLSRINPGQPAWKGPNYRLGIGKGRAEEYLREVFTGKLPVRGQGDPDTI